MNKLESIRVATDFSEHGEHAVRRAALLGTELGLESGLLFHVLDPHRIRSVRELLPWLGELQEHAEQHVREKLDRLAGEVQRETGFVFNTEIREGRVASELLRDTGSGDLVVIGGKGRHSLGQIGLGSSAERVIRKSGQSVLVVNRQPSQGYRRVVVPVDFSEDSAAALQLARKVAPGAQLYVLHAWPPLPRESEGFAGISDEDVERYGREVREQAQQQMDALLARCGLEEDAVQRLMQHDYAASFICQQARALGADLVVMGKHGHSQLADWLIGSVTTHVLNHCDSDMLVTRAG